MYSIIVPKNIKITLGKSFIKFEGPQGILVKKMGSLHIVKKDSTLFLLKKENVNNATFQLSLITLKKLIQGISRGFRSKLQINGVGFKAIVQPTQLELKIGFSHLVTWKIPNNIKLITSKLKGTVLLIKGNEPYKVSQIATQIRQFRVPDAYKGKGIKKYDEILRLKKGKRESK